MKDRKRFLGSEALGTLFNSWRDGTFSDILSDWKWILGYTRQYRSAVWAYTLLGVASSTLALVSAVASKYTIDIITGRDTAKLWFVITVMLLSALAGLLLRSLISRISAKVSVRVNNDIQGEVFQRLLCADWQEINQFSSGDLLNRLTTDTGTVASNAICWLPDLVISAYSFFATLAVLLYYDWIMALLAMASAPFLLLTSRRLLRKMRLHQQKVRSISSSLMAYETETLHNLDAIKGFGVTKYYSEGLQQHQKEYQSASLEFNLFSIRTEALLTLLGTAVQMGAFCYCLYLLWSGKIFYGTMSLFLSQGAKLTASFHTMVKTVPSFLSASVSARRIRELFHLKTEISLPVSDAFAASAEKGLHIRMTNASFSYSQQPVLQNADFTAAPGEIVALVGPSGGGKTTIIRLLLGLIHPSTGSVLLCCQSGETAEMNASLRSFFSYVPQGNTLLSGTIADNLRMVRPDADDAAMEQALRAACAWDFVSAMPGGLYASVGEHGHGLSEGQAQRIAIARSLLRAAPVLLLDEATSALDVATERKILRNLVAAYPNKTCIVTTHRPTVIGLCKRVYQIGSGNLHELSKEAAEKLAMDF